MDKKVEEMLSGIGKLEVDLGDPAVVNDQKRFRQLAAEHKYLTQLRETWDEYLQGMKLLTEDRDLIKKESDPELLEMLEEEIAELSIKTQKLHQKVETLLVPPDPNDNRSSIIELRAGTGGDEAAIFVGDCVRMYKYFAEKNGWSIELLSSTESDVGGFKEYQLVLAGENVYRFMQHEAGTHRVQRVPQTETQGRVHTSAITVAVMFEPDEDEKIEVDEKDLRIDTYRSSGAGGQHVNTTDSAVRITHLPTMIVVHCQEERSQIKNREKAMRVLRAKLAEEQRRKKQEEMSSTRAAQVGTGDRSERIRTYNFPQNRVTDHRIDLTLYSLDEVMEGDLDQLIQPLVAFYYQKNFETHEQGS